MKHLITLFVCVAAAALEGATVRQATEGFVANAVGELRRDLTNGSVRVAEANRAAWADLATQASTATELGDGDYHRDATTILRQLDAATATAATNAAHIAALGGDIAAAASAATNYTDTVGATKAAISNAVITATDVDYWTAAGGGVLPRITEGAEPGWYSWGPNGLSGTPILDYSQSERAYYYAPTISTTYYTNNPAFTGNEIALDFGGGVTLRRTLVEHTTNYYGAVYADDLAAGLANVAQAATNYTDATAATLYPDASGQMLAAQVAAIGAALNGEDARFVVTNYDSVVHTPEAYVEVQVSNEWLRVWSEATRWDKFDVVDHTWKTNMEAEVSHKADRAWGAYDSDTGGYSPDGYTQISSSNILVAANMAYQRTVTSGGAVWVLQCNRGVATLGGDTNGYFRVCDGDGNAQFEVVQGNKQTLGADADGISVDNSTTPPTVTINYSVVADAHPVLEITGDLAAPDWRDETDGDCIADVRWSGSSGAFVATVQRKSAGPSLFVKAKYEAGGETYIRNVAPVAVPGGILCTDGIHKVRPVYNNGAITWELVQ